MFLFKLQRAEVNCPVFQLDKQSFGKSGAHLRPTCATQLQKCTSVCAAGLVGFRVPLHSEPELMVPFPPGPLGLRPEDPPAVPVRPPAGRLLHESYGVAHKTRDEIVLQKQKMQVHSHFGAAARG